MVGVGHQLRISRSYSRRFNVAFMWRLQWLSINLQHGQKLTSNRVFFTTFLMTITAFTVIRCVFQNSHCKRHLKVSAHLSGIRNQHWYWIVLVARVAAKRIQSVKCHYIRQLTYPQASHLEWMEITCSTAWTGLENCLSSNSITFYDISITVAIMIWNWSFGLIADFEVDENGIILEQQLQTILFFHKNITCSFCVWISHFYICS